MQKNSESSVFMMYVINYIHTSMYVIKEMYKVLCKNSIAFLKLKEAKWMFLSPGC